MTFTPNDLNRNRTARLVSEAKIPVYSTETKPRPHLRAVEWEDGQGYGRHWDLVLEDHMDEHISTMERLGYIWSDEDHSCKCWCKPCQ